jgi:hypothetical protein
MISAMVIEKDFLVMLNMLSDIGKALARRRMPMDVHDIHWLFPNSAVGRQKSMYIRHPKKILQKIHSLNGCGNRENHKRSMRPKLTVQ